MPVPGAVPEVAEMPVDSKSVRRPTVFREQLLPQEPEREMRQA